MSTAHAGAFDERNACVVAPIELIEKLHG